LGRAFALALLARGAKTVYSAARDPGTVTDPGVVPIRLDITDQHQVAAAAEQCSDVTLLVNNAGVLTNSPLLAAATIDGARTEMEVNYFGTLAMCRAFGPVLAGNGGGAVVNMLSVGSWYTNPNFGSYSASKAAAWALTNGIRVELRRQGTLVVAVHAGYVDTDMVGGVAAPKISPDDVAAQTFDAVEAGLEEVLADQRTRDIKAAVPHDLEVLYPSVQQMWDNRT
jgi:NAD(P)-dependent dehydrogenase (short-subunit alcohol dehydrogenase family)